MNLITLLQHLEYLQRGTNDGRSQGVGEKVWTTALAEQVDDLFPSCRKATKGTAKRLTQRASINVHSSVGIEELAHTMTGCTYHTCRMTLIHHHQSIIFLGQIADLIHRSHITIHREHAIGHDDTEALRLCFL